MSYRFNQFCLRQQLDANLYLYTNFFNERQVLINSRYHNLLNDDIDSFIAGYPEESTQLIEEGFIVTAENDEFNTYLHQRINERKDTSMYHIIVNPTLDCNLNCWYCYEKRVKGSRIDETIIDGICKNIINSFSRIDFKCLKLSFFGGEPFLQWPAIKKIIEFASTFCNENHIELFLDFTTNATLIKKSYLDFLRNYACQFQITLDGNPSQHNKIKYFSKANIDTYQRTLDCIYAIQSYIPVSTVYVRINFDAETLRYFKTILDSLKKLDRKRTVVILKKIWQVDCADVDRHLINTALDELLNSGFIVDYYGQGGWCFADKDNQVTINYDGKIFRCTTIDVFDDSTALGILKSETGELIWNKERIKYLENDEISEKCKSCQMLPKCGGPCRKQMEMGMTNKCFLDDQGITLEEYAVTMLQINKVKQQVLSK